MSERQSPAHSPIPDAPRVVYFRKTELKYGLQICRPEVAQLGIAFPYVSQDSVSVVIWGATKGTPMKVNKTERPVRFDPILVNSLVLAQFLGVLFARFGEGLFLSTVVYAVGLVGPFLIVGFLRPLR